MQIMKYNYNYAFQMCVAHNSYIHLNRPGFSTNLMLSSSGISLFNDIHLLFCKCKCSDIYLCKHVTMVTISL